MKIGIVGPAGAGKSLVFSSLTGIDLSQQSVRSETLGVVQVPDTRLDRLSGMYSPKKTTPAEITFVDLGSATSSAQKLSALTGALSDADALAVVVGGFNSDKPVDGLESFLLDLVLADLSVVENRLERIAQDLQRGKKESLAEEPLMRRLQETLAGGGRVDAMQFTPEEQKTLRGYQFATLKPAVVVANVSEQQLGNGVSEALSQAASQHGLGAIELCAPLEVEISQLPPDDRVAFLDEYGLEDAARDRFVRTAYELTSLISFFTVGPDEVRAWSIRRGTLAPAAAGKIHSDIERGFIRAEVVAYDDLIEAGSHQECRSRGKVRLEGKTYEVQDGDVIDFRFAV